MSVDKQLNQFPEVLARFAAIPAAAPPSVDTSASHLDLDKLKQLLLAFRRLPGTEARSAKTFQEIANFPRSELACSNILAFFLDPTEEHGFGDLFLRSLLQATSLELVPEGLRFVTVTR